MWLPLQMLQSPQCNALFLAFTRLKMFLLNFQFFVSFCDIVMVLRLVLDWWLITVIIQLGSLIALLNFFDIRVRIFICWVGEGNPCWGVSSSYFRQKREVHYICLDIQCRGPRMEKVTSDTVTYWAVPLGRIKQISFLQPSHIFQRRP